MLIVNLPFPESMEAINSVCCLSMGILKGFVIDKYAGSCPDYLLITGSLANKKTVSGPLSVEPPCVGCR